MRTLRGNTDTNSDAYKTWVIERASEIEQENAAALDADPVAKAERAMDSEAQVTLDIIKTGYIPDALLPVERRNGRAIVNEAAVISNFKFFATTTGSFQNWMASQLWDAAERSQIVPTAPAYLALHNLMLTYSAYEQPVQPAITETEVAAEPVWSPSEQAVINHQRYCDEIIGHDESGKKWTMEMVDALPSKEMLRLLRLFEKGHRGSSLLDTYREILDIKQGQEAARARIAAEQEGGN